MAEGISVYLANKILDCVGNGVTFNGIANCYIQLHMGAPGAAGTTSVATETTRKAIGFGLSSNGTMTNDTIVEWTTINGTQDPTHYTLWDAATTGNFLGSGILNGPGYTANDTYTIAVGDIDLAFTVAT